MVKQKRKKPTAEFQAFVARLIEDYDNDSAVLAELTRLKEKGDIDNIFIWLKGWKVVRVAKALFELDWEVDDILRLLVEKWPRQKAINVLVVFCFDEFVASPDRQVVIIEEMRSAMTLPERRKALAQKTRRYNSTFCSGLTEE